MPPSGILSLNELLASMSPTVNADETFVFTTQTSNPLRDTVDPIERLDDFEMLFREREDWTSIVQRERAVAEGWEYVFPCKKVTLDVHSSLDAVGFLASVTSRLAQDLGVGVNPVSGFYHDHLFVPEGREGEVVRVLNQMAEEAKRERARSKQE